MKSKAVFLGFMMLLTIGLSAAWAEDNKLVGEWLGKHGEEEILFFFKADQSMAIGIGNHSIPGTYKVDLTAKPVTLDMTLNFPDGPKTNFTILEFLDENKIRVEEPGDKRPTAFEKDPVVFARKADAGSLTPPAGSSGGTPPAATPPATTPPATTPPATTPPAGSTSGQSQEFTAVPLSVGDIWKK
jgi:hypothetical protein